MKIYTKTGDSGTTALVGGRRVEKYHPRIEAYGSVDELMAHIAYLRDIMNMEADMEGYMDDLLTIMKQLMTVSALIASEDDVSKKIPGIKEEHLEFLEQRIDRMQAVLPAIGKFTLPGGHPLVSCAHICRTVCRRAERRTVEVADKYSVDEHVMEYINRLSDYLYVLGRKLTDDLHVKELYWFADQ